jgi:xylulokinase
MEHYLSLDVGTTSLKAAVVDAHGALVASVSSAYRTSRPKPNHVEHNPEDWWNALVEALDALSARTNLTNIRAIGLSGMAATHVLLDRDGHVLLPAILWQDTRAGEEAAELRQALKNSDEIALFGAHIGINASAQISRMLWLRRHKPEVLDRTHAVLGSKDYLAYRLTGEMTTDYTSTLAFANLLDGALHNDVAQYCGFDPAKLPPRLPPYGLAGRVTARVSQTTDLPEGTSVAAGMIDSWCNMLGSGLAHPRDAFDVAGTAEVVGIGAERATSPSPPVAAVSRMPFLTGVDVIYGVTQCGTDALTWFAESFADLEHERAAKGGPDLYEQLGSLAGESKPGSEALLFLPFLEGERSPFNDPSMRAGFFGVQRSHRKAHFVRAVLEGVAYSVRHLLETSEVEAGVRAEMVRVTSGGARSNLWNQIKADVLGRPVARLKVSDAGSIGAAMLAAVAVGDMELEEAVSQLVRVDEIIHPRKEVTSLYDDLFNAYLEAIGRTQGLMHDLAALREKG